MSPVWLHQTQLWSAGEFNAEQPRPTKKDPDPKPEHLTLTPHANGQDQPQIGNIYRHYLGNCNISGIDHSTCNAALAQSTSSVAHTTPIPSTSSTSASQITAGQAVMTTSRSEHRYCQKLAWPMIFLLVSRTCGQSDTSLRSCDVYL